MEPAVQQELEDAEFIPMPEDCDLPTPDQPASFSESITLPYEELRELKAAAAAVGGETILSVMPKGCAWLLSQHECYTLMSCFQPCPSCRSKD